MRPVSTGGPERLSGLAIGLLRVASWVIAAVPAGSGRGALAMPLYRRTAAGRPSQEAVARVGGGARLNLNLSDRFQYETFINRSFEPRLANFVSTRLQGGGTFLDIGAHVGLISIPVAARGRKQGVRVHAFEPDPLNAATFRRNLALNPSLDLVLNETAVGAEQGTATLARSVTSGNRALGRIVDAEAVSDTKEAMEVEVTTVDDYIATQGLGYVDVLKVDVEGYEPAVLAGAELNLAAGTIGSVICEINDPLLAENGWSRKTICESLARHGYHPVQLPRLGLRRLFRGGPDPIENVAFLRQEAG